ISPLGVSEAAPRRRLDVARTSTNPIVTGGRRVGQHFFNARRHVRAGAAPRGTDHPGRGTLARRTPASGWPGPARGPEATRRGAVLAGDNPALPPRGSCRGA